MPTKLDSRHAVYVGSFDPPTLGHIDIIRRGAHVFDRLTVGVGINPDKTPLFTPNERLSLLADIVRPLKNVTVLAFSGLAVEFIRQQQARVMLRGVRTLSDTEAEFTMALTNRTLDPEIETMFLMASERYTHVSSSLIKQIAAMGKELAATKLVDFVPTEVIAPLVAKFRPIPKKTKTTVGRTSK